MNSTVLVVNVQCCVQFQSPIFTTNNLQSGVAWREGHLDDQENLNHLRR